MTYPNQWSRASFCWIVIGAVLSLSACKRGPDFVPPETPTPIAFRSDVPAGESVANVEWWDLYQDPALEGLIRVGLENNRSIREALARIAEARASLGMVRADLYPGVNVVGIGFYQETLGEDSVSAFDNVKVGVTAGYELDLWGRVARSNEASLQGLLATEEAFRTVTIGLVADIATAYLVLRDLDARIEIAESTLETRRESLDLLSSRAEGGLVPIVDVGRAEINLAEAEATIQALTRARSQTENVLSLLVGRLPADVERGASLAEQIFPPSVPAGLPSALLERRPDIRGAERRLHAQTAGIGIAEATRFPALSLTGMLGVKSTSLGAITSANAFFNLGANLFGPLFNAGRNKQRVEVERARTEQVLNQYEQIVLNAFREVEDALVAVETYRLEREARLRQVDAASEALEVAEARYEGGLTSYMEVLDLQRSLFGSQLQATEALQLQHSSIVQLYRALGGGSSRRRLLIIGLVLAVPAVGLLFVPGRVPTVAGGFLVIMTLVFICLVILRRIFKHPVVTSATVSASLVVYLALGVVWAQAYRLVEHFHPGSFTGLSGTGVVEVQRDLFYYSYVTLATLGYGDINPVGPEACSLAITEALVGQLYLVVLVASLVGMHLSQRQSRPDQ